MFQYNRTLERLLFSRQCDAMHRHADEARGIVAPLMSADRRDSGRGKLNSWAPGLARPPSCGPGLQLSLQHTRLLRRGLRLQLNIAVEKHVMWKLASELESVIFTSPLTEYFYIIGWCWVLNQFTLNVKLRRSVNSLSPTAHEGYEVVIAGNMIALKEHYNAIFSLAHVSKVTGAFNFISNSFSLRNRTAEI